MWRGTDVGVCGRAQMSGVWRDADVWYRMESLVPKDPRGPVWYWMDSLVPKAPQGPVQYRMD